MSSLSRAVASAALGVAVSALVAVPAADASPAGAAVFVQNDNPAGNVVFAYHRGADGTLSPAGSYATGGSGGVLDGSVVDHLASQGAVTLDAAHGLLFAVNAGSDTVSVFGVRGDRLVLRQTLPSGGSFPVSVAVSGDLAYVLNARAGGTVSGLRIDHQRVQPIAGSARALGLDPAATPEFTHTPGQVIFTPSGAQLLVTTKANGNEVLAFGVRPDGRLTGPTATTLPGAVPFAGAFDAAGHLLLTEAGPNAVASFAVARNGALSPLDVLATGQAATCWIALADGFGYASNAGSGSLTGLASSAGGALTGLGQTATDGGTVDAAASSDGRFLYVQAGAAGVVDEYRVGLGGALTQIGALAVPGAAGGEGIAAS
jgi:hypothetical protein